MFCCFLHDPINTKCHNCITSTCNLHWQHNPEKEDPHKRTALHLAVTLERLDCVTVLLRHSCDANATNKEGWSGLLISFIFCYCLLIALNFILCIKVSVLYNIMFLFV